jgi:hypothetical protein
MTHFATIYNKKANVPLIIPATKFQFQEDIHCKHKKVKT